MVDCLPPDLLDGHLGGALVRRRNGLDQWRSPLSLLQLVSGLGQPSGRDGADGLQSIIAFVGTVFIVLSLSEIASVYPTAGGTGPIQTPFSLLLHLQFSSRVYGFTSLHDIQYL